MFKFIVIAVYALKNEHNQIRGRGGRPYLSDMYIVRIIVATAVWFVTIEKMNSIFFVALYFPPFFPDVLCRYFYCKMNVLFLSDTNLSPVELLHSVCFDQYKPLIV